MLSQEDKNEIRRLIATEIAKALSASKTKPEKEEPVLKPRVLHRDADAGVNCRY